MMGIIGTGSFGTALACVLANNNPTNNIFIYGKDEQQLQAIKQHRVNNYYLPDVVLPQNLVAAFDLETLVAKVLDILIVVPSANFTEVMHSLKPLITKKHRIVWATKGLDAASQKFLHQIVEDVLGKSQQYAIISGPSFAREVALGLPTAVAVAANNDDFAKDVIKYFHSKNFRVYASNDIIGVQLGGIIKNIFAVACGIADGLGLGANARAAIITRGLAEMLRLGKVLGAKEKTLIGLAGCGDMVLTCTDDQSRNRRLGLAIGKGKSVEVAQKEIGQALESLSNCVAINNLARTYNIELPIAQEVEAILTNKTEARLALERLMARDPTTEN